MPNSSQHKQKPDKFRLLSTMRLLGVILPPLAISTLVLLRGQLAAWSDGAPGCITAAHGLICPACGNTRSAVALLHGNVLMALRYNLTVPFLVLLGLAFYLENMLALLGKNIKIVPRSYVFLAVTISVFLVYWVARAVV